MGARHVINPDQLTLFERAEDLVDPDKFNHADLATYGNVESDGFVLDALYPDYSTMKREKVAESKRWDADPGTVAEEDYENEGEEGWEPLRREGHPSLYESIQKHGVKDPIRLKPRGQAYENVGRDDLPTLMDGHHRAFTANDIDPKSWVPVRWD